MAGLSYVGCCKLWLAAFLTARGKTAKNRKEATAGGTIGAILFSVACIIVCLGLLANDVSPVLAVGEHRLRDQRLRGILLLVLMLVKTGTRLAKRQKL